MKAVRNQIEHDKEAVQIDMQTQY